MNKNLQFLVITFLLTRLVLPADNGTFVYEPVSLEPLSINENTDYLCYYGSWNDEKIFRAKDFNLVILEPSNIAKAQIADLKNGHDGISATEDDVLVIGYISVGEAHSNNIPGDGRGPCYYNYSTGQLEYTNKGYASWYLDDADRNGLPDENANWGSYYVNAGDTLWQEYIRTSPSGADNTLVVKECDGLFLDTIDSASPWSPWPYRWMVKGMTSMVKMLRETYPDKYIIVNRGLFYFDPQLTTAYDNTIRPYIDGVMFESYSIEYDRTGWADKINTEATKEDGFKVIALDYFESNETSKINKQVAEVAGYNWGNFISSRSLNEIRYDVFHRHNTDSNPPTWISSIGLTDAIAENNAVVLKWKPSIDQSEPLTFNIYYAPEQDFNIATAAKVSVANSIYDPVEKKYIYKLENLSNYTTYEFIVRAVDRLGNEDFNTKSLTATPPNISVESLIIDGLFSDWASISNLDVGPGTTEIEGDAGLPDADISDVWASVDDKFFFLSYSVKGNFSSNIFYHVFIDIDADGNTGYVYSDSSSTGAELMIENSQLWKYTGSGGSAWGWTNLNDFQTASSDGRVELAIPLSIVDPQNKKQNIHFIIQNNKNTSPFEMIDVAPDNFGSTYFSFNLAGLTDIQEITNDKINITDFRLFQNYPNPFNPTTTIEYSIPYLETQHAASLQNVVLKIYDLLGREVAVLVNEMQQPGKYKVEFDGSQFASGIYMCKLISDKYSFTRKMLLIK